MLRRVIAYHLIMTAYGFWLPNDPRGSWSDFVRSWELSLFGPATKIDTDRSVAGNAHDYQTRLAAKNALVREPVEFTGKQCQAIGNGFLRYCRRSGCVIHACSILPTHTHLVVIRMQYPIEQVANLLKGAATSELARCGLHPFADRPYGNGKLPSPWARHEWACFLDCDADILRSIEYTELNPVKQGKPRQRWLHVTPYAAWRSPRSGTLGYGQIQECPSGATATRGMPSVDPRHKND
jgi:REP element-mobilizing transposase RayT